MDIEGADVWILSARATENSGWTYCTTLRPPLGLLSRYPLIDSAHHGLPTLYVAEELLSHKLLLHSRTPRGLTLLGLKVALCSIRSPLSASSRSASLGSLGRRLSGEEEVFSHEEMPQTLREPGAGLCQGLSSLSPSPSWRTLRLLCGRLCPGRPAHSVPLLM